MWGYPWKTNISTISDLYRVYHYEYNPPWMNMAANVKGNNNVANQFIGYLSSYLLIFRDIWQWSRLMSCNFIYHSIYIITYSCLLCIYKCILCFCLCSQYVSVCPLTLIIWFPICKHVGLLFYCASLHNIFMPVIFSLSLTLFLSLVCECVFMCLFFDG